MNRFRAAALLFMLACQSHPTNPKAAAALEVTRTFAQSGLSDWKLQAHAVGRDCDVLYIEVDVVLDETMVEAVHYGAGSLAIIDGGIQKVLHDHRLRGVIYEDISGQSWPFGNVTEEEAKRVNPCE